MEIKAKTAREENWFRKVKPDYSKVMHQTFEKINELAPKGVFFNSTRLLDDFPGGICSAVALAFAKTFLECTLEDHHERLQKSFEDCMELSGYFKAQQIAFNTIEKCPNHPSTDFKRAKIQSLANYYGIKFDWASEDLLSDLSETTFSLLKDSIKTFPMGSYIIRILLPMENHKEEYWGHTAFYLKDPKGDCLFDPNYGLTQIAAHDSFKVLKSHLLLLEESWDVNNPRFYRINEERFR